MNQGSGFFSTASPLEIFKKILQVFHEVFHAVFHAREGGDPGGEPGGDPGGEPAQVLGEWERKGKGEREAREVTQEGICYI